MSFRSSSNKALLTVAIVTIVALTTYFSTVIRENVWFKMPGKPSFLKHRFTDAGLGHKFSEVLFSMDEAQKRNLPYCLDEESFLANSRGDDYSLMLPVLYAVVPKCPDSADFSHITEKWHFCDEGDCFFSAKRYFNEMPMFRLWSEHAGTSLGIHLRFGDIQVNGDIQHYTNSVGSIRSLTGVKDVAFCYNSANEDEEIIAALRKSFPEAEFVNSKSVEETMSCLTKGRMMLTSGSSLSYLAAYLCKRCVVFFVRPKEFHDPNADPRTSIYYVDRYVSLDQQHLAYT